MTNQNTNHPLHLRYEPYANSCLAWSISDEIICGKYSFAEFKAILLKSSDSEARRYAEVLYHKTKQDETILLILKESLEKRLQSDADGAQALAEEFKDWGLRIRNKKVIYRENLKARSSK